MRDINQGSIPEAKTWLKNNIKNVATVIEWARAFGYDDLNKFRTAIWKEYEVLPSKILTKTRLEKAKALLKEDSLTYREVAAEIGLPDGKALYKYFIYHTGEPPSYFQQSEFQIIKLDIEFCS